MSRMHALQECYTVCTMIHPIVYTKLLELVYEQKEEGGGGGDTSLKTNLS